MHIGAAGQHVHASRLSIFCGKALCQNASTLQGALLALLEFLGSGNLHSNGLGSDHVHQRSALLAREDVGIDLLGIILLGQNHAGARATQGLMHGGGHDIRVRHWARVQASSNEASKVGHIYPQVSADLISNFTEGREIHGSRVSRPAADNDLRLFLQRLLAQLIHVHTHGLWIHLVGGDIIKLAREVQLHAVGKVAAVSQGQAQNLVARFSDGGKHRCVRLRTGVRLNVGEFRTKEFLSAVAG